MSGPYLTQSPLLQLVHRTDLNAIYQFESLVPRASEQVPQALIWPPLLMMDLSIRSML